MAKIYEFYLREPFSDPSFFAMCDTLQKIGSTVRKVDGKQGSYVYAISWNSRTSWVQIAVDDNTPADGLAEIETVINQLCDGTGFDAYTITDDTTLPSERERS